MKIDGYSFGKIVVDNKEFDKDVIVLDGEVKEWVRKESHNVVVEDITVVDIDTEVIVIGTGESGLMKVDSETVDFIEGKGIELVVENTGDAVRSFNSVDKKKIGFFHLTC